MPKTSDVEAPRLWKKMFIHKNELLTYWHLKYQWTSRISGDLKNKITPVLIRI